MSHKHASLLQSIFHDPVGSNIHWRQVESLLLHLGASVEPAHGAVFRVMLNGTEGYLHHPHQSNVCSKQNIKQLREYLVRAGINPALDEGEGD